MLFPLMNIYLTPAEQKAIEMVANGQSNRTIRDALDMTPANYGNFMAALRKKTGIPNTKDARFSREYLEAVAAPRPDPTPEQLTTLEYVATHGFPVHDLCLLSPHKPISSDRAASLFDSALKVAGIFARNTLEWRVQCAAYLAHRKGVDPQANSLSELHKRTLRLYASGKQIWEIADILHSDKSVIGHMRSTVTEKLLREGLEALGVVARGRGVQRRLVGIALAAMGEAGVTMEDPMF